MSRIFRRALATFPPRAGPSSITPATLFPSASSAAATLPIAVRRRRTEHPPPKFASPSPLSDPALHDPESGKKFPLPLEQDYRDLLRTSEFDESLSDAELRALFLKGTAEWKARVRGYAPRGKKGRHAFLLKVMGGQKEAEGIVPQEVEGQNANPNTIVGQRIYLPNIQIRLMRNHTPPGEAYDPFIATFRIPPSMTKTDLRSYLAAVYNLQVTFIRTDNYLAPVGRTRTGEVRRLGGKGKTYKRAVVGLTEPFHYPDDLEELHAQSEYEGSGDAVTKARDKWLQDNYSLRMMEEMKDRALFKYYKGSRWRAISQSNVGVTVKEIMKRRKEREAAVAAAVKERYAAVKESADTTQAA
ncbi:hypothetical protein C366_05539 [Cryptococcus neoformans Tu401-1]|nr:hypothetical protein C366_05539 [Cryptococcus neoformans var. grubii Tu401-1]OXM76940.1 hypothetical protein C364_05451 [Cryptococcus neoformans var. grubii Bt63]